MRITALLVLCAMMPAVKASPVELTQDSYTLAFMAKAMPLLQKGDIYFTSRLHQLVSLAPEGNSDDHYSPP